MIKNVLILLLIGMATTLMMMANSSESILTFRTDTATTVYNLEADGNHNYYVSASGVLVHNTCKMFSGFGTKQEMAELFNVSEKIFHRELKGEIIKDFSKELIKKGVRNPDIGITTKGNIMFRNPSTKKIILETDIPYTIYRR